jgi:hypothetical protein
VLATYQHLVCTDKKLSLVKSATYESQIVHPSQSKNKNKKKSKSEPLTDQQFLDALKADPLNSHVDLEAELLKMDKWLARPENAHRKKTRRFITGWIGRIEKPLATSTFVRKDDQWAIAKAI